MLCQSANTRFWHVTSHALINYYTIHMPSKQPMCLPCWHWEPILARLSSFLLCALCEAANAETLLQNLASHILKTRKANHAVQTRSAMLWGSVACPRRARTRGLAVPETAAAAPCDWATTPVWVPNNGTKTAWPPCICKGSIGNMKTSTFMLCILHLQSKHQNIIHENTYIYSFKTHVLYAQF